MEYSFKDFKSAQLNLLSPYDNQAHKADIFQHITFPIYTIIYDIIHYLAPYLLCYSGQSIIAFLYVLHF